MKMLRIWSVSLILLMVIAPSLDSYDNMFIFAINDSSDSQLNEIQDVLSFQKTNHVILLAESLAIYSNEVPNSKIDKSNHIIIHLKESISFSENNSNDFVVVAIKTSNNFLTTLERIFSTDRTQLGEKFLNSKHSLKTFNVKNFFYDYYNQILNNDLTSDLFEKTSSTLIFQNTENLFLLHLRKLYFPRILFQ